ncbi:MAG: Fe(2+) transporter FeoB [Ignavibacteriaceae bacterium]|nr:Fe(2+) transporter FeoB [Ignavibacteriaceae bacterium]
MKSEGITAAPSPGSVISPSSPAGGSGKKSVVLVGNPNVGKSLFFNHLSGMYVDVSNFPGTTVSISKGHYKNYEILDTPGVYGVSSFNDEEKVARDVIVDSDILLNVVNSLHLERDIFLTMQLIDMGKKISVLLNFSDEVRKQKIKIDASKLSNLLGVPVFETSAVDKKGFEFLDEAIQNARQGHTTKEIDKLLSREPYTSLPRADALLILEGDEHYAKKHGAENGTADDREMIYVERRNRVNQICADVEFEDSSRGKFFNLLGRLSINPLTGIPVLLVMLYLMYLFIGDVVSQRVVGFTEDYVGKTIFEYNLKKYVAEFTPSDITVQILNEDEEVLNEKVFSFSTDLNEDAQKKNEFLEFSQQPGAVSEFNFPNAIPRLFFGEFGVVSMTVTYLLFLLLPLVIGFYLAMAVLEDSGYLPRLATMMDRSLTRIGLNGRAVIPILLGFGCVTMATITTRILGTDREKTIATAILQFVIPCSAQLAVIAVLISGAGLSSLLIYVFVIFTVLILISTTLNKFLPGQSSPLLIDLPIMRIPRGGNVLKKTYFRTLGFMKEASVWFFVGALFVGLLEVTGWLYDFQDLLAPITTSWLKLPKEAATAFVMGVVRRDFGAAGLFSLELTAMQVTVAIITITLFVPCIASFMVMLNERGLKEGLIIWASTCIFAFLIGGIVAQIIV